MGHLSLASNTKHVYKRIVDTKCRMSTWSFHCQRLNRFVDVMKIAIKIIPTVENECENGSVRWSHLPKQIYTNDWPTTSMKRAKDRMRKREREQIESDKITIRRIHLIAICRVSKCNYSTFLWTKLAVKNIHFVEWRQCFTAINKSFVRCALMHDMLWDKGRKNTYSAISQQWCCTQSDGCCESGNKKQKLRLKFRMHISKENFNF